MVDSHESKMISVLFTTDQFLATLAYPIKSKIKMPISKKQVTTLESIDAAIEVSPIIHGAHDGTELAKNFYEFISQDSNMTLTKNRRIALQNFLELCGEKIRGELLECLENILKEIPEGEINHVFVNFVDKSGKLCHSKACSLNNILLAFDHIKNKILLWKVPKKRSPLLIQHEEEKEVKARRKERLHGEKKGGMRRYRDYNSKRAA